MTYFTKNTHGDAIDRLLSKQNTSVHSPFSQQKERIVHMYLDHHNLNSFASDPAIITYYGGDPVRHPLATSNRDYWPHRRAYTQNEFEQALDEGGFVVKSWIPTAYANPYKELDHYSIRKHWSLGVTQEELLYALLPSFRYSVYATKKSTLLSASSTPSSSSSSSFVAAPGRATLTTVLSRVRGPEYVFVVDRVGGLGATFGDTEVRAGNKISTAFSFSHYSAPKHVNLTYIAHPHILPSLAMLSSSPSVEALHEKNRLFWLARNEGLNDTLHRRDLYLLLDFLEKVNAISFTYTEGRVVADDGTSAASAPVSKEGEKGYLLSFQNLETRPEADKPSEEIKDKEIEVQSQKIDLQQPKQQAEVATSIGAAADLQRLKDEKAVLMREMGFAESSIAKALEELVKEQEAKFNIPKQQQQQRQQQQEPVASTKATAAKAKDQTQQMLERFRASKRDKATSGEKAAVATGALEQESQIEATKEEVVASAAAVRGKDNAKKDEEHLRSIASIMEAISGAKGKGGGKEALLLKEEAVKLLDKIALASGADKKKKKQQIQESSTATSSDDKSIFNDDHGGASSLLFPREDQVLEAIRAVKLPSRQSMAQLLTSVRSPSCTNEGDHLADTPLCKDVRGSFFKKKDCLDEPRLTPECDEGETSKAAQKRPWSSSLNVTSLSKLIFDKRQLRYIAITENKGVAAVHEVMLPRAMRALEVVTKTSTASTKTAFSAVGIPTDASASSSNLISKSFDKANALRLMSNSEMAEIDGSINRAVYLAQEPFLDQNASMAHSKVLAQLTHILAELEESDFVVIDSILQRHVLTSLSHTLLTSTIWFDVTNGQAFVARHDDGLVYNAFARLAQELAASLTLTTPAMTRKQRLKKMRVDKYFVVAMNILQQPSQSPIMMAQEGQIALVLWLGPPSSSDGGGLNIQDGITIYEPAAALELHAKGYSINPAIHPDFFSSAAPTSTLTFSAFTSPLQIDVGEVCSASDSDLVQRATNRLILIGSNKPFVFVVPTDQDLGAQNLSFEKEHEASFFEKYTSLAFVAMLSLE